MSGFLNLQISVWWRTALVRLTTLGPTLLVAVFAGRGQDSSLGSFTEWLNIVQSLVLPFAIVPVRPPGRKQGGRCRCMLHCS